MNNIKLRFIYLLAVLVFASCSIDDNPNPNGPSLEAFNGNVTKSELQTLVTGSEDLLRQDVGFYYDVTSIIGRDYYFFTGSDPRYTGELLGKGSSILDRAGFYGTRPYYGRYRTIKNLNIMIDAAGRSDLITPAEAKGYLGFAKTLQAYEYHLVLNLQYKNGIRTDVKNSDNLGPFVTYEEGLTFIANLLNEANDDLNGASFAFRLSSAMASVSTASDFAKFNRALAARIALYQNNSANTLTFLATSFMNLDGDLNAGVNRYYSSAGGDFANNLFRVPNQADAIVAQEDFVSSLESGDLRASKIQKRTDSLSLDGLTGSHDVVRFKSLDDFVPMIRNEELILIYAEANLASNPSESVRAINIIRTKNGLTAYTGGTGGAALLLEIAKQRRFSLYAEGHRWVDMRRWGRLSELPKDRADDDVWEQLPRPISEN